jgi:hypothetical protein
MDSQEALTLLKQRGVEIDLGDHRSPLDIARALGYIQMQPELAMQLPPQSEV